MLKNATEKTLSGVFIGSFDLLTGIRLCYQKNFKELTDQIIDDIIKISLSNVHRQEQKYFENFSISTIEIQCYQLLVTIVIFNISSIQKNKHNTYFSVGLIFDTNKLRKNEHLNEMLIFWTKILAFNVKNLLLQNNSKQEVSNIDYSSLDNLIDRISYQCTVLSQSKIASLPPFDLIKPFDQNFYATALTSHLQTQMTTVIELPSFDENDLNNISINFQNLPNTSKAKSTPISKSSKTQTTKIPNLKDTEISFTYQSVTSKFNDLLIFLAHFTLPSQLDLSSLEVRTYPIPGLFLQIVCSQKVPPEEFLSISPRPTTWIRLQNMKIFRTNEKLFPEQSKNAIQSNLYTSNENDTNNSTISPYLKPFWSISSKLKKDQINKMIILTLNSNFSQWAFSTVSLIKESPKFVKKMITEQQFSSIIRLALAFIAIKNERLEINNGNNEFLSLEIINDIQKNELELESNEDFLLVISLAQIYDKNTYKQMHLFLTNTIKVI